MKRDEERLIEAAEEQVVTLEALDEDNPLPSLETPRRKRRKRFVAFLLLLSLIGIVSGIGYWWWRSNRIDLQAKRRMPPPATNGSDIRRAAYESLSGALTEPVSPSPTNPAANIGAGQATEIAIAGVTRGTPTPTPWPSPRNGSGNDAGIAATLAPPPDALPRSSPTPNPTPLSNAQTSSATRSANAAQSVRFALVPEAPKQSNEKERKTEDITNTPAVWNRSLALPDELRLPPFGALLPVRLLGALYTLRQNALVRLEVQRDMRGEGWQLKRGTVLVGQVTSGEMDRAFVQIKGLLTPETNAFIKLTGEVLGADGGAGLRGKRRRVASVWGKVLDRAATAGTQIATGILGRQNSSVLIATDPAGVYRDSYGQGFGYAAQNRTFVEVAAGTMGYVLVTRLPEAQDEADYLAQTHTATTMPTMTDDELAEVLATADPKQIRAALPKMNPALRRAAQTVLQEIER